MSNRESIARNIVSVLESNSSGHLFKLVTREPFDFDKLSNAQFPAVLVRSSNENREDTTIGAGGTKRTATIDYEMVCYVKSKNIDPLETRLLSK